MLLAILFLPILLASANPFHKYPYVFLLDIGNEELEKVNTEQIRLSSPGGSVALRYPAIGNGDDIAHVRVSGIDFGTDLKANVLDGGPGYKYVVIVLMGNPGVPYDAVITIQTVPTVVNDNSIQTIDDNSNGYVNEEVSSTNQLSENDPNNSAEDLKDYEEEEPSQVGGNDKNGELTQESSNVYSYEQNEALSGYGSKHNDEYSENDEDDDDSEGNDNNYSNSKQSENVEQEDYDPREDDRKIEQPTAGRYTQDEYSQSDSNPVIVDQNLYNRYLVLEEYLKDGSVQSNSAYDADQNDGEPINVDVYDDYEDNDLRNYRDANNNNFIDTDETSAVEQ